MNERLGAILLDGNSELRRLAGIERTAFLGYPVDSVSIDDVFQFVELSISKNANSFVAVQNANKIYLSDKYPKLKEIMSQAALTLPENAMNIGMSLIGNRLKARNMGGVKVMEDLLGLANERGWTVYFLGATRDNLNKMITQLGQDYWNLRIVGYRDGYFQAGETEEIIREIAALRPNLLFVGMGSPKQEFFIGENITRLNANIAMGVGGSFNVFAGVEKQAPAWTKHGLEWLYRSIQDSSKLKRYLIVNSYFLYKVALHLAFNRGRR